MAAAFFGVQIAFDLPLGHRLRQTLTDLVRESRGATAPAAQRALWTRAADALVATVPTATWATWDLIRDRGQAEYEDWASGLEAMAQWPLEDFGADGAWLLASAIFLVERDSNADLTLGDLCDLPERDWHRRATYQRLLAAPPTLNFTNVLGSGLYLAPRPDHPGFSEDVLRGEGFEYLVDVVE